MEWTPNKSQHTKLTLEKKILSPLLPGFELATFRSRVRRPYQQAIPTKAQLVQTAAVIVLYTVYYHRHTAGRGCVQLGGGRVVGGRGSRARTHARHFSMHIIPCLHSGYKSSLSQSPGKTAQRPLLFLAPSVAAIDLGARGMQQMKGAHARNQDEKTPCVALLQECLRLAGSSFL